MFQRLCNCMTPDFEKGQCLETVQKLDKKIDQFIQNRQGSHCFCDDITNLSLWLLREATFYIYTYVIFVSFYFCYRVALKSWQRRTCQEQHSKEKYRRYCTVHIAEGTFILHKLKGFPCFAFPDSLVLQKKKAKFI